jgi:carbon-monoxide dehydrogenase small subunit
LASRYALDLVVNGRPVHREVAGERTLLELIREDLRLTGTNLSCDSGDCGACTVLVDGRAQTSCLVLALDVSGQEVTTVEGLAARWQRQAALAGARGPDAAHPESVAGPASLHPVQQGFLDEGGAQCGFCTAGMVVAAVGLLEEHLAEDREPTVTEIQAGLEGNLCRCTGYTKIVRAVEVAARQMREARTAPR